MTKVTIIDYGVGNLLSLKMSLEFLGAEVVISRDERVIENSSHIILPGVGAFPKAMEIIKGLNLDKHLIRAKNKGTFILGICLGMQLFFDESLELLKERIQRYNASTDGRSKSENLYSLATLTKDEIFIIALRKAQP